MSDSDVSVNFAEYSYEKTVTKKDKLHRALYVAAVVFIMLLPVLAAMLLHVYVIMYIMPLIIIVGVPLARFFFRYLQYEYKYTVDRSSLKMELIHGKAKPSVLFEADAKDIVFAVAEKESASKMLEEYKGYKTLYCCTSTDSADLYVSVLTDRTGRKLTVYFDGSKKALKILNYYNKNVVISDDLMH